MTRSRGTAQVNYHGHPLVLSPAGDQITSQASSTSGGGAGGSGAPGY